MKCFSILTLVLMITLILSACGAKATPSPALGAVDMQSTVAAVALTVIAETQAAIPTATPQPTETITNTPAPTNSPVPPPFSNFTLTPIQNSNSGGGEDCIHKVLPAVLEGKTVKMRINNSTKAAITLSVNLQPTIPQGQCGYRTYSLEPQGSVVITDLVEGCYSLWAWNPEPKDYFMVTNGTSCIDSSSQVAFDISTRDIRQR